MDSGQWTATACAKGPRGPPPHPGKPLPVSASPYRAAASPAHALSGSSVVRGIPQACAAAPAGAGSSAVAWPRRCVSSSPTREGRLRCWRPVRASLGDRDRGGGARADAICLFPLPLAPWPGSHPHLDRAGPAAVGQARAWGCAAGILRLEAQLHFPLRRRLLASSQVGGLGGHVRLHIQTRPNRVLSLHLLRVHVDKISTLSNLPLIFIHNHFFITTASLPVPGTRPIISTFRDPISWSGSGKINYRTLDFFFASRKSTRVAATSRSREGQAVGVPISLCHRIRRRLIFDTVPLATTLRSAYKYFCTACNAN